MSTDINIKHVELALIRTDGETQMRAELNRDVYLGYRDDWLAGMEFPPLDVFYDGVDYWLADGFHRYWGAKEAKLEAVSSCVRQGTQRDAQMFAAGANQNHGLRRSNADKRRAVEWFLNDDECVTWSDNKIAKHAGVTQPFVSGIRKELKTVISSPAAKAEWQPRVGMDGKSRQPKQRTAVSDYFAGKGKKDGKPKQHNDSFEPEELEKPKVHRADADMPPCQVDCDGNEVPKSLIGVFEKRSDFTRAARLCRDAAGIIAELKKNTAGRNLGDIGDSLVEAAEWIEAAQPWKVEGRKWLAKEECDAR